MDTTDNIKIAIDLLKPLIEGIWGNHKHKQLQNEQYLTEIQTNESVIQNNTYSYLFTNIFLPLRLNFVAPVDTVYFIPLLKFDPFDVCKSDYWEEGHKHLVKDIDDFDDRFSWIRKNVIQFNNDLENFEAHELKELISCFLEENGFSVSNDVDRDPYNNTFLIRILLDPLKDYWTNNVDFRLVWDKDLLKINNTKTIASGYGEIRGRIEDCVIQLKTSEEILKRYFDLTDFYNMIIRTAESLSKELGKKVIIKIEKGTYETTCDECTN